MSLDLAGLGFARATPAATGRPAYDPADLLKLYVYGYLNRVRSWAWTLADGRFKCRGRQSRYRARRMAEHGLERRHQAAAS